MEGGKSKSVGVLRPVNRCDYIKAREGKKKERKKKKQQKTLHMLNGSSPMDTLSIYNGFVNVR